MATPEAHDPQAWQQMEARLAHLLQIEAINREISRLFLEMEDLDAALNRALALTGQQLDVSRVYVFRIRENVRIMDNTHEWCTPGVKPEIDNLKDLPMDDLFPSFFPMIAEYDLIAPQHISELPDDLRSVLEPQDVQTVLWMPIYLHDRIEGFVGYDETRRPRRWLPEEMAMVRTITESYARALERERARRMLIDARDEAIRTAELRSQFVANMSHEIRTPMTGVLGMLELLLETDLDDLQMEFAREAYKSSRHLLNIINDVLDFSKLEAGQLMLEADPLNIADIVTEVSMTLEPQAKDKPVTLITRLSADLPHRVSGDATRIRQVLMNLAGNALKFTHQGQVTLSADLLRVLDDVAVVRFTVVDTGIGIAREQLERIFESFVQADGATTRKYGGTGLGLPISRQLVELMGGSLAVSSEPNAGSTFSFTLRLPVIEGSGAEKGPLPGFEGLRTGVIGANRTARYLIVQHLENWGVHPQQADDLAGLGAQASPFDLLFVLHSGPASDAATHSAQAERVVLILEDASVPAPAGVRHLTWPVDQSSLFNVLAGAAPPERSAGLPPVDPRAAGGRILVADDYPDNVDLVLHALSGMPVHIDVVGDGQEVLNRLEQAAYDLILMDVQMPVMDGIEATRLIRASEAAYRAVPILVLTASVMPDEQQRYLAEGANAVITKPFFIKDLREAVSSWLARRPALSPGEG